MSLSERFDYSLGLLVVSAALCLVPLFDMWEDITVGGKSPVSTLLENSVVLLLTITFVAMSVWLRRSELDREYVQLVGRWSMAGTGFVAVVYGWVLGFQLVVQNDLKPYIIAADGVVIGGIVLFVAGVYNARSQQERAARALERDRFSALFDNTSDAIVAVEFADGEACISDINDPFARTFGQQSDELAGQAVVPTLTEWAVATDTETKSSGSPAETVQALLDGDLDQAELRWETPDGRLDSLVRYVSVGGATPGKSGPEGFLVATDITSQKERERQFETLNDGTEALLDARSPEDVFAAVQTLALDLLGDAVVGVWEYDPETNVFQPRVASVAGGDGESIDELPALAAGEADTPDSGASTVVPEFDTEELGECLAARGYPVEDAVVRRLTDSTRLVVARRGSAFSTTDRYLLGLLVANTRTAIQRVDREEQLARRNDQLEFINSLLRHDIQNSMTIIRARGQALAESLTGQDAAYAETVVDQSDDVRTLVDRFRALLDALTDADETAFEPTSLSTVVEERVDRIRDTYPSVSVSTEVPDDVDVLADDMLGNVIGNVLGNAVEHNDTEEPTVEVVVTETDRIARVEVADDGPGIPDDQKEAVFRRGNQGLKEADIGSGFGLFFVNTIIERYGGTVTVGDNDPRGAVFVLEFPKP